MMLRRRLCLLQIEYLLKKLTEAMGSGWQQALFEDYKISLHDKQKGLSVWELIELIGSGQFSKGTDFTTVSMAINEVFNELVLDVLKQVMIGSSVYVNFMFRYLKGNVRSLKGKLLALPGDSRAFLCKTPKISPVILCRHV